MDLTDLFSTVVDLIQSLYTEYETYSVYSDCWKYLITYIRSQWDLINGNN
jgi:hypothetical protein